METPVAITQIAVAITTHIGKIMLVTVAVGSDGFAYQLEGNTWIKLPGLPPEKL